jgi:phosphotriesterase-related protein
MNYHDEDTRKAVVEDVKLFKEFGGQTIVENTTHGLKRDLKLMYEIAKETGVNVVAGTGHYVKLVQENQNLNLSVEEMVQIYTKELIGGIDVNIGDEIVNIKCGFIGEIGSAYPISGQFEFINFTINGFKLKNFRFRETLDNSNG